jgi:hypothetical protein
MEQYHGIHSARDGYHESLSGLNARFPKGVGHRVGQRFWHSIPPRVNVYSRAGQITEAANRRQLKIRPPIREEARKSSRPNPADAAPTPEGMMILFTPQRKQQRPPG